MYLLERNCLASSCVRFLIVSTIKVRLKVTTKAVPIGKKNFL